MLLFKIISFVCFYLFIAMLAASLGYHRFLAHKSVQCQKWFEYMIVLLGLPAGTPLQWAGNHRAHHLHEDSRHDPHSPKNFGILYAHTGWYLQSKNRYLALAYALGGPLRTLFDAFYRPRTNQQYHQLAKDIEQDPVFNFFSRPWPYAAGVITHLCFSIFLALIWIGPVGILVYWCLSVYIYNIGDAVNSIGHLYGDKPFRDCGDARDNSILGILAFGDGWHAGHHCFPNSARHGLTGQFDICFETIRGLHFFGIIKSFHLTEPDKIKSRLTQR